MNGHNPMRFIHVTAAVLVAFSLAAPARAAESPADLYRAALAREQAARAQLEPSRHPTPAVLRQVRAVVHAYEIVVLRYPRSGYCDNALWHAAQLASDAFTFFGQPRDRSTAVRLIHWLQKEYPHSRYAHMAPNAAATPRKADAPARRAPPERTPVAPPRPAPAPSERVVTRARDEAPPTRPTIAPLPPQAVLQSVTRAALTGQVRVTLTLDREVLFKEIRLHRPARLVVELPRTKLAPTLKHERLTFPTPAVRTISVTPATVIGTNVNIDLTGVTSYSTFVLYNPYRLVVDCQIAPAADDHRTAADRPATPARRTAATHEALEPAPARRPLPLLDGERMIETTVTSLPTTFSATPELSVAEDVAAPAVTKIASARLTVSPYPVPGGRESDRAPQRPLAGEHPAAGKAAASRRDSGAAAKSLEAAAAPPATSGDGAPATADEAPTRPPATNLDGGFSMARQLGLGVSRIVIDPGHGGRDPGAQANGITEANLVLDIALRLEKLLKQQPGIQVILTRRTDVYVPLQARTAIANRAGADLFLSIHANASRNPQAHGIETYFLNFASNPEEAAVAARENATSGQTMGSLPDLVKAIALNNKLDESRDFATMIQHAMYTDLREKNADVKDLGVKQAPFAVLIGASMPSVLAEVSFLTNPRDARYLKRGSYQQQIAEALLSGILRYQHALKSVRTADNQDGQ